MSKRQRKSGASKGLAKRFEASPQAQELWAAIQAKGKSWFRSGAPGMPKELGLAPPTIDRIEDWLSSEDEAFIDPQKAGSNLPGKRAETLARAALRADVDVERLVAFAGLTADPSWKDQVTRAIRRVRQNANVGPSFSQYQVEDWGALTANYLDIGERIARSIDPDVDGVSEARGRVTHNVLRDDAKSEASSFRFQIGLFRSTRRQARSRRFISLPGWRPRIHALYIAKVSEIDPPSWKEVVSDDRLARQAQRVVIDGEASHEWLLGPCALKPEVLQLVQLDYGGEPVTPLLDSLVEIANREGQVLFLADEHWCQDLYRKTRSGLEGLSVEPLHSYEEGLVHRYPEQEIGISIPPHNPDVDPIDPRELIESALREVFETNTHFIAKSYADAICGTLEDCPKGYFERAPSEVFRPRFFELGSLERTIEFWNAVHDEIAGMRPEDVNALRPFGGLVAGTYPLQQYPGGGYVWGLGLENQVGQLGTEPRPGGPLYSPIIADRSNSKMVVIPAPALRDVLTPAGVNRAYEPPKIVGSSKHKAEDLLFLDRQELTEDPVPAKHAEVEQRRFQEGFPRQKPYSYPVRHAESLLVGALADQHGLDSSNILVGPGSMELISQVYSHVRLHGDHVLVPTPSFWPAYSFAQHRGMTLVCPRYELSAPKSFRRRITMQPGAMEEALACKPVLAYLVIPDNPFGAEHQPEQVDRWIRANPGTLFVIDGAYMVQSASGLWGRWDNICTQLIRGGRRNVLLCHTFSKEYGLAGLRVGYLVGAQQTIDCVRIQGGPYGASEHSLAWAYYAHQEQELVNDRKERARHHRVELESQLRRLKVDHCAEELNSLVIFGEGYDARLEELGIVTRRIEYPAGIWASSEACIRVTVPSDPEAFERLTQAVQTFGE